MKKVSFLMIFTAIALAFFVSCGGNGKEDDNTDSGDTVTDTGDTEPTDTGDSEPDGDTEPADTGDSEPDGDTEPADTGDSEPDGDTEPADTGDSEPDGDAEPADTGDIEPDDDTGDTGEEGSWEVKYQKADEHAAEVSGGTVTANNDLGMKIFSRIAADEADKNVMISPLSISIAMAMSTNGASGENLDEMKEALGFGDMELADVNEQFKHLIASLVAADKDLVLSIADSVWMREDYSLDVKTAFTDVLEEFYEAEIFTEGFTVENINAWVSEKTNGKIDKIIEEIGEDVVMYLINAIYFKAAWTTSFSEENTREEIFTLSDGTETTANFMSFSEEEETPVLLAYSSDSGDKNGFSMIRIPYGRGVFAFYGIVPTSWNKTKIDDFIAKIAEDGLESYLTLLHEESDVSLKLPRFKFEYEKSLVDIFKDLGMEKAFEAGGFHNIAELPHDPFISNILHKTFIEVNEAGTEAAAVTAVEYSDNAISGGFYANRPFVFVIRDDRTGSILFIGKVENPEAE